MRILPAGLLVSFVLLNSQITRAQTPPEGAPAPPAAPPAATETARKDEARARFAKGIELVQSESWDAALAEFLASRELYPTQAAIKNAAVSLRQLKRNAEALDMYEELEQRFGPKLSADDRKAMELAMTQLRALVAEVVVVGGQPGAIVVIDGKQRGSLPLAGPVRVDAGTRHVRVFREGFVPFETELMLAGAQKKEVLADLVALAQSGRLRVEETSGKPLQVVVDGAVVGTAPWVGVLSVGTHTVLLQGPDDLGAPPTAATVKANEQSTLRLEAGVLDTSLRVEPTPTNARIDIDGIEVGHGVWEGRLKSAAHRIELTADGFLPSVREVKLESKQHEVLRIALERDLSNPRWNTFRPHLYAELVGGLAITPSLGGSADQACSSGACSSKTHSIGVLVGARGGFQLTKGLGVELFFGYFRASESVVRKKTARADVPTTSDDYADGTTLSAPLAAASLSYSFFEKTPLTARFWGGAMRAAADFTNSGTFRGTINDAASGQGYAFSQSVSIPEASAHIWVPFVAPEVRFGYRFGAHFAADVGLAAFFLFAPSTPRIGTSALDKSESTRSVQLNSYKGAFANGNTANPGLMRLDPDVGFGTFLSLVPSVAARVDF